MEERLSLEFLRVVENAAVAAARTMGFGDRPKADEVAVEAMRKTMDQVEMDGTIVIGEGERDEAPMLYIGEKVGLATHAPKSLFPQVDIAVDPLEGTNLCATGAPNAITVLAASERGGLLHAPDLYMEKIVVGPSCKGAVELDAPVGDNLKSVAKRLDRDVEDLVVMVLDRDRHQKLINEIRAVGARIRLIGDGNHAAATRESETGEAVPRRRAQKGRSRPKESGHRRGGGIPDRLPGNAESVSVAHAESRPAPARAARAPRGHH